MAKTVIPNAPNDPMTLRSIIQKIVVTDNKLPITFNIYDKNSKLILGFIHSKESTKAPKVIKDDYEFLDGSLLTKAVLNYNIISTNSVSITLEDEINHFGEDDPVVEESTDENTEENND